MTTTFDISTTEKVAWTVLPLEPKLYGLLDNERDFFRTQTGIQDDEELKDHILAVQKRAYDVSVLAYSTECYAKPNSQVVPYPCIRLFNFCR